MRLAVAQFAAGMDKAANFEHIAALTARAADAAARVVVLPEGAMCDFGGKDDDLHRVAEPLDGRFVTGLAELASRHRMTIVAGMFESIPDERLVYNAAVAVDPAKGLVGVYHKRHLFDAFGEIESERFRAGQDDPLLIDVDGFTVAVVICYDIRFASFIERAADGGAELLVAPAAWVAGPLKEEHLSVLVRARALDNTMYVGVGAQIGAKYTGRSAVVDPLGVSLAGLGDGEGVATAEILRDRLQAARKRLPVLAQRRAARAADAGRSQVEKVSSRR
ncbi:MAG TPA: carbon-nitrogen hydrolase family protein [Candidatus Dormibacteraeota bacterium]